ncbi:MAG: molybdopterin biosynthesis protein [Clostridia bacterium]|nr:molybdopterin biosynthesis protein [Clostridia bacterium]
MKHSYLSNTPLEAAKARYRVHLKSVGFACKTETVAVTDACGRIIKNAARARICSPHYNASAMDGVAVRAERTFGASERNPVTLTPSDYTVVDTGDPLPAGCNAVIMVEDLIEAGGGNLQIISAVYPWQNVRQVGEDLCMGDMIAPSGTALTPALCGALLAGGVTVIEVLRPPRVGIIPTGDEIVPPTGNPGAGEIIEFNSTIFTGMLAGFGAQAKVYPIVRDNKDEIRAAVETALAECEIVLVSAGSSAGRDDYTSEIIAALGTVLVHGIAIKPGKPAVLGEAQGKPVIGVPGYPVSAIVILDEIVSDVVALYYGRPGAQGETIRATLAKKIVSSLKYTEYVRVSLGQIGGRRIASPLARGAGVITSFTTADGILRIPQDCEGIEAGEEVEIRLHKPLSAIDNTLIITGSHDPLIDEVADFLAKQGAPFRVCSTHVGSMGAIFAVRDGLAHMGGIHLLDPATGEYNKSYIEKYVPAGNAVAVKGVGRVQGLMVQKGNPLGIRSFADIRGARYVNRQRGAGTRVLCDHLLAQNGISPEEILGYGNEEFTHTAVAALIAAGNADAGLGIYAAAKMYDLDFIPICNETYDFLIGKDDLAHPMVEAFLATLRSPEFKARLQEMGGYTED